MKQKSTHEQMESVLREQYALRMAIFNAGDGDFKIEYIERAHYAMHHLKMEMDRVLKLDKT